MKYLILGAGPAGLTCANRLLELGEASVLVLEKENESGGLCRSMVVDGTPLDIGGGHFLDTKNPRVNEYLFRFMPRRDWDLYERNSKISLGGELVDHPLEANIWQLTMDMQVEYLKSIAAAGSNMGMEKPKKFIDWIYWKLGKKIADDYMIPYNRKMFCEELNLLGTYWLEKLPNVSFEETLRSCLAKRAYGTQPGHSTFYYPPKYGYGELWTRMADCLGEKIKYQSSVLKMNCDTHTVICKDGEKYQADIIITTIPWRAFREITGIPRDIKTGIQELKHTSIQVEYIPKEISTDAHWVYYPESDIPYHRVLARSNFCPGSRGYWTETNAERIRKSSYFTYMNPYAYPLNTMHKPQIMKRLLEWASAQQIYGLGRWGEHQHYNSDVTVDRALTFVENFS